MSENNQNEAPLATKSLGGIALLLHVLFIALYVFYILGNFPSS